MDKKEEARLLKVFSKAFHEVVPPLLEDLASRLEESIERLEELRDQMERRFDKIDDRMDRHGKTWEDHEKRLGKLERLHPGGKHPSL